MHFIDNKYGKIKIIITPTRTIMSIMDKTTKNKIFNIITNNIKVATEYPAKITKIFIV